MGNAVELNEVSKVPVTVLDDGHGAAVPGKGMTAPLSFAQQQIWLHAQLVPDIPIYNEPVTVQRRGTLDASVLARVLTEIVRRHQAWRTTFVLENGEPVQVISPVTPVQMRVVDLKHLPALQSESEAQRLADDEAIQPFNLSTGPLFRALLVHLSDTEHRLFLTLHHIIFDGYSIYRVLLPELATLYEAFSNGQPSPLPELTTQYSDFAQWEREWLLQDGRLQSQLAYWRKQLAGNLSVLQLPSDRSRPPVQSFRGAIQPVVFSKELTDTLKIVSRREGATLFMGLIAAFAVLLYRYCSSEDVAIGTVSSGRKRSELESLLGYFLNPVVLRNDLSGDPTFRELLRRTREATLDALSNDDAPFPDVVHEVHPERSLSFHPLFQALLTLEPPVPATQDGWTVALTQSEVDTGFSKFDLCLELDDRPAGLVGRFKYSTDLFDAETVARMAGHLKSLLEDIVADPDRRISQLALLTPLERQQISIEWNNTAAEYPADRCVHELFVRQAELTPETVAVVAGDRRLTYSELQQASDRLAAALQLRGVGPEAPVGLYLEPSCEMAVAILGVLKAGGVCVPLDPNYPAERFAYVLEDTQLRVILTQESLRPQIPPHGAEVLGVDTSTSVGSRPAVRKQAQPESVAYLIYTSGSTGRPKGVQVTHANLVHSTHARFLYYGSAPERFLLLSSFAFDSSLAGILSPLCSGGTLVMTPGSVQSNLTRLARLVDQHHISSLLCVPSMYSLLLEQAEPGQLASLRVAIVAGESCPAELVRQHFEVLPRVALFNEYGPTEAAVWSTVYKFQPGKPGKLVPIGRPIPNAKVYVLDTHLNLLPVGVPGELYIGGLGVARGYLNLPEETQQKFIPDPFSEKSDARLYKTGDLVRYLPDGNLELLGRLDNQVKIRGFRIELEEIEAVIGEYQGVRQAVVTLGEERNGETGLIAYVVPASPSRFEADSLRRFVSDKLPEAMVPTAFVVLDRLPLMPNGKVDRQALPAPPRNTLRKQFVEPQSALESVLMELWEAVLGKHGFGVTENFFDLGGHSLLVAKLLLRIEQKLGKRILLADVFRAPTVRELAARLEVQSEAGVHNPAIVPIQSRGSKPPIFWVRGGSYVLPLTKRLGSDQPVLGLHLPVDDAVRLAVPYKFEDIAAALIARLREVQPEGPYYLAGLCVNGVIAYEMARQLALQGHEIGLLALFDAQNPAYYEDFSQESHSRLMLKRAAYQLTNLRRQRLGGFLGERLIGIRRHLSVRYWRIHNALGLPVKEKGLQNLDSIVHPASFVYRPEPYPGPVVFFQSTDWPKGRYWDFHASWDGLVGGMQVFRIRGGHESMFHEENVDLLSSKLQRCLSEAMRNHGVVEHVA